MKESNIEKVDLYIRYDDFESECLGTFYPGCYDCDIEEYLNSLVEELADCRFKLVEVVKKYYLKRGDNNV